MAKLSGIPDGPAMPGVPAAAQVLAILRYLGRQAGPVAAAAIGRDLGLPRSTTYHLLATLVHAGFVVHLPEERRYALGVGSYELGTGYTRQAPLQRLARVPLATLVDRTGQSAHLAVLHGREVIYVIEERATGRPPLVTDVGVRLPAQLTASGRAMLAMLPAQQVRALFPDPSAFVLRHGIGPTSYAALHRLLGSVRRTGYATEDGEITPGFASVAVAVRDHAGHPVASVAITYPLSGDVPDGGLPGAAAAGGTAAGPMAESTVESMAESMVESTAVALAAQVQRTAAEIERRIAPRHVDAPRR